MIALSVKQPWADFLVRGLKDVENRTWRPPWDNLTHCIFEDDGRIGTRPGLFMAIHAGKGWDRAGEVLGLRRGVNQGLIYAARQRCGGFVGTVIITGFVRRCDSIWFAGPWGWMVDPLRSRAVTLWPAPGRLRLFPVPDDALPLLRGSAPPS